MLKTLSALLIIFSAFAPLQATDFYVSPDGLNTNPGTLLQPWKTIQKACNSATAGSTVYIMAGTYTEQLSMKVTGTDMDNYITFRNFGSDEVIIDGGTTDMTTVLLNIEDKSFIRIEGLHFRNAVGAYSIGIIVQGASSDIQIVNNEISNIHFSSDPMDDPTDPSWSEFANVNPLIIYGNDGGDIIVPITNILINGNSIHDCRTGYSEGMTVTGNVDGFTINGNFVYNISNIGIDIAGGYSVSMDPMGDFARHGIITGNTVYNCVSPIAVSAGIYADGSQDLVIEHNNVHDCGRGFEVGCERLGVVASNIIVRNNLAWHNLEAGIGIGGYNYPATTGKVVSCKILNNSLYDNVSSNVEDGELLIEYTEDCVIENNIFYATNVLNRLLVTRGTSSGTPSLNLKLDYNLYYHPVGSLLAEVKWYGLPATLVGFIAYQAFTMQDPNSQFIDPNFEDPTTQDFHLGAVSPAYNAGDPDYMPLMDLGDMDIDGEDRITYEVIDIGADEASTDLPIEYARPLSGLAMTQGIALHWTTAYERDAARFDIERSTDGASFEKIGDVSARGTSNVAVDYGFMDPKPKAGANYYRLKQIDLDGTAAMSNVALVKWQNATVTVSPNPTSDYFEIKNAGVWHKAVLRNALGQVVRSFQYSEQTTLSDLKSGVYRLELFMDENGAPQVFSLIKQ